MTKMMKTAVFALGLLMAWPVLAQNPPAQPPAQQPPAQQNPPAQEPAPATQNPPALEKPTESPEAMAIHVRQERGWADRGSNPEPSA